MKKTELTREEAYRAMLDGYKIHHASDVWHVTKFAHWNGDTGHFEYVYKNGNTSLVNGLFFNSGYYIVEEPKEPRKLYFWSFECNNYIFSTWACDDFKMVGGAYHKELADAKFKRKENLPPIIANEFGGVE